jgi:Nif-specific regulatory protein
LPIRPNTKSDPDAAVRSPPSDVAGEAVDKAAPSADVSGSGSTAMREVAQRAEREKIIDAMERAGWMKAKAARLLGLTPRQIGYALTKYNIAVKRF